MVAGGAAALADGAGSAAGRLGAGLGACWREGGSRQAGKHHTKACVAGSGVGRASSRPCQRPARSRSSPEAKQAPLPHSALSTQAHLCADGHRRAACHRHRLIQQRLALALLGRRLCRRAGWLRRRRGQVGCRQAGRQGGRQQEGREQGRGLQRQPNRAGRRAGKRASHMAATPLRASSRSRRSRRCIKGQQPQQQPQQQQQRAPHPGPSGVAPQPPNPPARSTCTSGRCSFIYSTAWDTLSPIACATSAACRGGAAGRGIGRQEKGPSVPLLRGGRSLPQVGPGLRVPGHVCLYLCTCAWCRHSWRHRWRLMQPPSLPSWAPVHAEMAGSQGAALRRERRAGPVQRSRLAPQERR